MLRFLATLHGYILREMLKVLALTVLVLTLLITISGGLFNILRIQGATASDFINTLPLLLPIVFTLTLPVAALFAATMVYGRIAADNELTACRAAGINVHRLFFTAVVVATFVAAFGLLMGNFVLPSLVKPIMDYATNNVRDILLKKLQKEGAASFRRYTLTAQQAQLVQDEALEAKGWETGPGLDYLLVTNATFMQTDESGKLVRFTIARHGLCVFDKRRNPLELTLHVNDVREFQVKKHAAEIGSQPIGPVPLTFRKAPFKLSPADLRDLARWRQAPWEAQPIRDQVNTFMAGLTLERFYKHCAAQLADGHALELVDDQGRRHRITAEIAEFDKRQLKLREGSVEVHGISGGAPTRYEAEQLELRARPMEVPGQYLIEFTLVRTPRRDVLEFVPVGERYEAPRSKPTLSLDGLQMPEEVLADVRRYSPADLLDAKVEVPCEAHLANERVSLQNAAAALQRRIVATIHFRMALLASALVTVVMGAALGVILRGAHILAAIAVALIPFFAIGVVLVLGQKLAEDAVTAALGPFVMWGGLVAGLVVDGVLLRVGVRR